MVAVSVTAGPSPRADAPVDPSTQQPTPAPTRLVGRDPDAFVNGNPVWLGPTLEEEARLPEDRRMHLSPDLNGKHQSATEAGLEHAVMAFADTGQDGWVTDVWLVGDDGTTYTLDLPELDELTVAVLDPTANQQGYPVPSFTASSLSPEGTKLAFADTSGIVIYDLPTNTWTIPGVPDAFSDMGPGFTWASEETIDLQEGSLNVRTGNVGEFDRRPSPLGGTRFSVADWWGQPRWNGSDNRAARAAFSTGVTVVDAGYANPEAVVVEGKRPAMLVINGQGRFNGCCAAARWLDKDTVVFESRSAEAMRLLGWNTRTGDIRSLAKVLWPGEGGLISSYADVGQFLSRR